MRKIVLLTIAGLASAFCSLDGVLSWTAMGHVFRTPVFGFYCAFLVTAVPAFLLFLRLRLIGLVLAWMLPASVYICLLLLDFAMCRQHGCTTTNPYQIAWGALSDNWPLVFLLIAGPVCMLLDYTAIPKCGSTPVS